MTMDAGGGTADLSLYTIHGDSPDRANLRVVSEGRGISKAILIAFFYVQMLMPPAGVEFGGERLTQTALNYIKDRIAQRNTTSSKTMSQALNAKLCKMNISENQLDHILAEKFEWYKAKFTGTGEEMVFHVSGRSSLCQSEADKAQITGSSSVLETVKPHVMERWMRREYGRLREAVSEKLHGGVTYLCLTGGSLNSPYFTRRIREDFGKPGLEILEDGLDDKSCKDVSVIRGWMARRKLGLPETPQNLWFCILQTEPFDPKRHEAAYREGRIKRDDFTGKLYAESRVKILLRPVSMF